MGETGPRSGAQHTYAKLAHRLRHADMMLRGEAAHTGDGGERTEQDGECGERTEQDCECGGVSS